MVLVDSSAWIEFFNKPESNAGKTVTFLLESGLAVVTGPIVAEVVSGAPHQKAYTALLSHLGGLRCIDPPEDVWRLAGRSRFELARRGVAASLIDIFLAWTCVHNFAEIFTLDSDFARFPPSIPIKLLGD